MSNAAEENNTANVRAHLALSLADGVGAIIFRRLVEVFGDAQSVLDAGPGQWRGVEGVGAKKAKALADVTEETIDTEIALADERGVQILCLNDPDYPEALKTIYDPPPVLYVWGQLKDTDSLAAGIVGSRRCTHYGLEQADRFAQLLARAGFTVVSGGARGIDTSAHRAAMMAGGRTIAVMGCGLCHFYPPENAKIFEQIVAENRGALVSEIPMAHGVQSRNFPKRNRIISGLSLGVLIVEAAQRSGSLITASQAAEQGRQVFAIPGRVDSAFSQGANELIRDGAILVQNLDDILEHLGTVGEKMAEDMPAEHARPLPDNLDETESAIVGILASGAMNLDDIIRETELDCGRAAASLTMLSIKGVVSQQPGNIFSLKRR